MKNSPGDIQLSNVYRENDTCQDLKNSLLKLIVFFSSQSHKFRSQTIFDLESRFQDPLQPQGCEYLLAKDYKDGLRGEGLVSD